MREGLSRAMLVPIGTAWADIYGGVSRNEGPFIHGEIIAKPLERVGVFAFGQISQRDAMAGIGARFELDW